MDSGDPEKQCEHFAQKPCHLEKNLFRSHRTRVAVPRRLAAGSRLPLAPLSDCYNITEVAWLGAGTALEMPPHQYIAHVTTVLILDTR